MRLGAAYETIGSAIWTTGGGDLFYAIAVAHTFFEPIESSWTFEYQRSHDEGGLLVVNGQVIEYAATPRLLANGPFGEMHELQLTPAETKHVLGGDVGAIWEQVVEKRLYRFEGASRKVGESADDRQLGDTVIHEGVMRVGHWTIRDTQNRKAFEGDYVDGKRHGRWTYYFPSGSVKAEIGYEDGEREGPWLYYDEDGQLIDTITWHQGTPAERAPRTGGLGESRWVKPDGSRGGGN